MKRKKNGEITFVKLMTFVLISLVMVITFLVTDGLTASKKVIKIGVLAPLTGGAAADGEEIVRGAKLAVKEINKAGGVNGYTLELIKGDVKDQVPDAISSAFKKIVADKDVNVMMGGYVSGTNFELGLVAEKGIPYLYSANATQHQDLFKKHPGKYSTVWNLVPSFKAYETDLPIIVEQWAKQGKVNLKTRKVAMITSDHPYSKSIYKGLKDNFAKMGWTITVEEIVPFGDIYDWRAILAKVRKDPPDLIVNTDYLPANEASFMEQFMEDPTDSLVFMQYGPSVPEFVELTQEKSTGVLYNLLGGPIPTSPISKKIAEKYKKAYGVEAGTYGHTLYWQVKIYADALAKVGDPTNWKAISKAIGEADLEISAGRLKFDPKTHLAMQGDDYIPITFWQIREGKRYLLTPKIYSNGEFKLPAWIK